MLISESNLIAKNTHAGRADNPYLLFDLPALFGVEPMKEIWKDVPGYESKYQVSDLGNVRSVTRKASSPHVNGWTSSSARALAPRSAPFPGNAAPSSAIRYMGGIGLTLDHDLQIYCRRANAPASTFGNVNSRIGRIADTQALVQCRRLSR